MNDYSVGYQFKQTLKVFTTTEGERNYDGLDMNGYNLYDHRANQQISGMDYTCGFLHIGFWSRISGIWRGFRVDSVFLMGFW